MAEDIQKEFEELFERSKQTWAAETPDGREVMWILSKNGGGLIGDSDLITEIEGFLEEKEMRGGLKLNFYQTLPANLDNKYSVKLALETLYRGKAPIMYSGNVPDLNDVIVKIPHRAVE
jgi:hypothetical protein